MPLYKSQGLSSSQQMQKALFEAPKGSLCYWGVCKIHYFNEQKAFNMNLGHGIALMHVITVAMPFFAMADTVCFAVKAAFKCVICIREKSAKEEVFKGLHALKLIATTFFAIPFAVFRPLAVYKDHQSWKKVIKQRLFNEMSDKMTKGKGIEKVFHETVESLVKNEKVKGHLKKIAESMIREIFSQKEKKNLVMTQYISLFAKILASAAFENIALDRADENFAQLVQNSIVLRNPKTRRQIFQTILDIFSHDKESWDFFCSKKLSHSKKQASPFFIASLITRKPIFLDTLLEMTKDAYFKDRIQWGAFLETLIAIKISGFDEEVKKALLFQIISCFKKDKEILSLKQQQSTESKIKGLKKKARAKEKLIARKEKQFEKAKQELAQCKENENFVLRKTQSVKQQQKNLNTQKNQLEQLRKEIAKLVVLSPSEPVALASEPYVHFKEGIKNLTMLLALKDQKIVQRVLDHLQTKHYSLISDSKIVSDLFSTVFERQANYHKILKNLRAPFALITFFSRIKEDKSRMRESLITSMKEVIHSILENTLWKDRHDEAKNSHLAKVFAERKNLKYKWMHPHPLAVKELVDRAHERFKDYQVIDCKDPTDILLIGDEMHTCVHLRGRLSKVKGLMGFIRDGKTHTIAVKDEEGKIVAETQVQLMFDDVHQKPVLYVDQINFKKAHPNDYTLEHALYNFAKRRANELELDLVSRYKMQDPTAGLVKRSYSGTVKSLGSSSPLEYVNSAHTFKRCVFDLGKTYLLQKFVNV